ncbi:MAG TPA: recombinase RecJ [Coriobacteriia bacterium]|nr:recombinase RecJ [Coriobacteriia bacterium]
MRKAIPMNHDSLSVEQTLALLEEPREVVLCGHLNPDGDALGSILALAALLETMGHTVTKLLPKGDKAPGLYDFFDGYEGGYKFTAAGAYGKTPDLFIVVDAPNKDRLGEAVEVFDRAGDTLVIDHHPDYTGFANHYLGDVGAPATGLLVWKLIRACKATITPVMAMGCYVSLMTDTGHFAFQNTTADAFIAAGEMVAAGVSPSLANTLVYDTRSIGSLELDSRLISRLAFAGGGKVVYSWVTLADFEELGISRDETEGLPTILRSVKGVEIAILLREEKSKIRVNLRAKGDYDVGAFAHRFGGGGHKAAAGFTTYGTLKEAEAMILEEADTYFSEIL